MSDLVTNPNCWFSHAQAHLLVSFNRVIGVFVVVFLLSFTSLSRLLQLI